MGLFYTLLLLLLLVLLARWIKSKEAEWIGSYGEYKVRKAIKNRSNIIRKIQSFS